jgi:hypothetical protein
MAEYIEREKLLKDISETVVFTVRKGTPLPTTEMRGANKVIDRIKSAPTADVVEVVRCKDCEFQEDCARQMVHTKRDYVLEQNISTYNKVDFCSYGELKEQQND